jgi:phytoene dehydrogenase-like protein
MADFDAVIVGAGQSGLVSAVYLARAGWHVLVLERADEIGGGIRSGAVTAPGFWHDRYATNVALFAGSPVYQELKSDFDELGVRLIRTDKPYASVFRGRPLRVYTNPERTFEEFGSFAPADASGWQKLTAFYRRTAQHFLPLFSMEMLSAEMLRHLCRMAAATPADALRLAGLVRQTSHAFAATYVQSAEARGMLASWGYHLDFAPDIPGGAVFAFVAAQSGYVGGMPIVEGGAGNIINALRTMIEKAGGRIVTGTDVTRIVVRNGRAVGVRSSSGEEITARRAVIANVTTRNLFTKLVDAEDLDSRFRTRAEDYRYGPGTFVVHLALNRLPVWNSADDLSQFNYIHVNGNEVEITETYRQSLRNFLPERPLLVVSQTTPSDPTRAPPGCHVMRIHVRTVPGRIEGDAANKIGARTWSGAKQAYADRVLDLVEEHVPDLRQSIIASAVETPEEIEKGNPNFIGGDCVSGSHHFNQNFFCRPVFGWARYKTPIAQLYMIGSSTWPGGGVNPGSGYLVARKLIAQSS